MPVSLGEEIMLLSLDDESGAAKELSSASWAVAGGIVLDLALAGRVSVTGKRVAVTDRTPVGDALLDGRLTALADWCDKRRAPKVASWLTKDQARAPRAAIESMVGRGLVTEQRRNALGIFIIRRYPEADGTVERELRARLKDTVLAGARPDDRTAGLVALLQGAKLHRIAFPRVPRKEVEPRMKEIADGQWAGREVREAIREMQAAMLAVTAATVAVAAG